MTNITPKPLDYVFQHNVIGRGVHTLPQYLRRLVAVGMSHIKQDENMEVCFSINDALDALGMSKETYNKNALKIASSDALGQTIKIDNLESGIWTGYTWFQKIVIDSNNKTITMKFNEELRPYIMDFTERFALFTLCDYGRLTGEYTQKMFDLVISYRGHAGKDGNAPKCWFFEYPIFELRTLLNVTEGKYKATQDLRKRVIDGSVNQINTADIGVRVECEYKYKGKTLNVIRFNCKEIKRTDPRPVNPATQLEDEDEKLKFLNFELYNTIEDEIRKQPSLIEETRFGSPEMQIEIQAMRELKKRLHKK